MSSEPTITATAGDTYYAANAERLLREYEQVRFEDIHEDLLPLVLAEPGSALDVGFGSGRDAAWLARHGWSVVAVDPSLPMLKGATTLHREPNIDWRVDRLPTLMSTKALGRSFELILLSAVLMHVPPSEQPLAIDSVVALASYRATISITVRSGGSPDRGFFEVDLDRISRRLEESSFFPFSRTTDRDLLGRSNLTWKKLIVRRS